MFGEDYEREALKEQIFAVEREELLKQTFSKGVAKITYNIYEDTNIPTPLSRVIEKGI